MNDVVPLRLSYSLFADIATAQIGKPGRADMVPLRPGFVVFVRREDPLDVIGFQFEAFSEEYAGIEQPWLKSVLGESLVTQLNILHRSLPRSVPSLEGLEGDALSRRLAEGYERLDAVLPAADEGLRESRRRALREWASTAEGQRALKDEDAFDARPEATRRAADETELWWSPQRIAAASSQGRQLLRGSGSGVDAWEQANPLSPEGHVEISLAGPPDDHRLIWAELFIEGAPERWVAPLSWDPTVDRSTASLSLGPRQELIPTIRVQVVAFEDVARLAPENVRESIERASEWTKSSWKRVAEDSELRTAAFDDFWRVVTSTLVE